MGIENPDVLSDREATSSSYSREKFEADHREKDAVVRESRAEIELEWGLAKAAIEDEYQTALADLNLERQAKHKAIDAKRLTDLEAAGLNPSGSDPRRYPENNPQGSFA